MIGLVFIISISLHSSFDSIFLGLANVPKIPKDFKHGHVAFCVRIIEILIAFTLFKYEMKFV